MSDRCVLSHTAERIRQEAANCDSMSKPCVPHAQKKKKKDSIIIWGKNKGPQCVMQKFKGT